MSLDDAGRDELAAVVHQTLVDLDHDCWPGDDGTDTVCIAVAQRVRDAGWGKR